MSDTNWSKKAWDGLIEHAGTNQDGGGILPPAWKLTRMREDLLCFPLRFGGDDHGYLFWLPAQNESIVGAMSCLKQALGDLDEEIARGVDRDLRIKQLESEVELLRSSERPAPKAIPKDKATPKAIKPDNGIGGIYLLRASGQSWAELGGNSVLTKVKRWAISQGKAWPPCPD